MRKILLRRLIFIVTGVIIIVGIYWYYTDYRFCRTANQILERAGIQGGLIVHLGFDNGKLATALCANDAYLVHGLSSEKENVKKAREYIHDQGLYGAVSVEHWDQQALPYANNLVNLLVTEETGKISKDEIMRVMAPGGVVLTRENGKWKKTVKSRPEGIDDWTHYLHGADNNAVARDTAVGPPQSVQWISSPPYARSHEFNSSMAAMVSSGSRLFYIWDEGPIGVIDKRLPSKWKLIARNAFNGKLLWKRPMPDWGWRQWHKETRWDSPRQRARMLRLLPPSAPRRLVADSSKIYVTLGYKAPVSVLNAATGKKIREFEQTALTEEILLAGDTLILRVRSKHDPPESDVWGDMPKQSGRVMAVNTKTGKVLWKTDTSKMAPQTIGTKNGRVYYSNYKQVVCLDMNNGNEQWRSETLQCEISHGGRGTCGTLVPQNEVVLYTCRQRDTHGAARVFAFSAKTGEILWKGPYYFGAGRHNPFDLFVIDEKVWVGNSNITLGDINRYGLPDNTNTVVERKGYDLHTGKAVTEISVPHLKSAGHHARCYRSKATERFLLLPKRGVEFLDLKGNNHMRCDWLRAPCLYGTVPANGLLYMPPHPCVCYPGVLLKNFNALTADGSTDMPGINQKVAKRVDRGPAWKKVKRSDDSSLKSKKDAWPTYRQNSQRSGSISSEIPSSLEEKWVTRMKGEISPPVVADNRLLVAEKDAHTIHALDASNGEHLWRFTAGGPIDSPPTVYGQLVLFGCADGHVYCLRASDGRMVWKFMAAPRKRRILVYEQLESAWPVHGSVMVKEDATTESSRPVVYFTAGRSTFLDGGIQIFGLDPYTGKVIHRKRLKGPYPNPYEEVSMQAGYMNGAQSGILVSDGADIYLYQERLTSDLTRVTPSLRERGLESGGIRMYEKAPERNADGKHLITTSGFLDDTYNEGTFWTYGRRWPGWSRHLFGDSGGYGQLLVFNENTLFGVNVMTKNVRVRRGFELGEGERLFARDHDSSKDTWSRPISIRTRGMVLAKDELFVAGPPDIVPEDKPLAALQGKKGCRLLVFSTEKGKKVGDYKLKSMPVFDGMIAAENKLYLSMKNGSIVCLTKSKDNH